MWFSIFIHRFGYEPSQRKSVPRDWHHHRKRIQKLVKLIVVPTKYLKGLGIVLDQVLWSKPGQEFLSIFQTKLIKKKKTTPCAYNFRPLHWTQSNFFTTRLSKKKIFLFRTILLILPNVTRHVDDGLVSLLVML